MNKLLVVLFLFLSNIYGAWGSDADARRTEIASRAADAALKRLKSKMLEKISEKGSSPEQAIPFCHVAAVPTTIEEVSGQVLEVRRATLKPRNSKNLANDFEEKFLKKWESLVQAGKPVPKFETEVIQGQLHYVRPLMIEGMCLSCHGSVANVSKPVAESLKKLYPGDLATGYQMNDIRGLIHVVVK